MRHARSLQVSKVMLLDRVIMSRVSEGIIDDGHSKRQEVRCPYLDRLHTPDLPHHDEWGRHMGAAY